jgi:hypothetical protein
MSERGRLHSMYLAIIPPYLSIVSFCCVFFFFCGIFYLISILHAEADVPRQLRNYLTAVYLEHMGR